MSEYNNFNGYQQNSEPVVPIVITPDGAPSYEQPVNTATKFNAYGLISILLAPLGCCCCAFPAVIGLIVGIVGLTKYKKNILCIIGIVLCALTILYYAYSIIYTIQHPEEYQEIMDMYMEMLEQMEQMEQMEQVEQTARFFFKR